MSSHVDVLRGLLGQYRDVTGVEPEGYLAEPDNINIVKEESAGLFVYQYPGVYVGHYLFNNRGKDAVRLSKEMLSEMFSVHGAKAILGLTPVTNRPALLMTRRLGFQSHGTVETQKGLCEMFIMTKKDYEVLYG